MLLVSISFVTTSVSRMSTRKSYLRASLLSPSVSDAMYDCGVERQQTPYLKRFSFMFIMVHEARVLLYVFSLTTSVGRDEE